jgi:hypothetical protein
MRQLSTCSISYRTFLGVARLFAGRHIDKSGRNVTSALTDVMKNRIAILSLIFRTQTVILFFRPEAFLAMAQTWNRSWNNCGTEYVGTGWSVCPEGILKEPPSSLSIVLNISRDSLVSLVPMRPRTIFLWAAEPWIL